MWSRRTKWSLVQEMACPLLSAKPLTKPVMTYYQFSIWEYISMTFISRFTKIHLKISFIKLQPIFMHEFVVTRPIWDKDYVITICNISAWWRHEMHKLFAFCSLPSQMASNAHHWFYVSFITVFNKNYSYQWIAMAVFWRHLNDTYTNIKAIQCNCKCFIEWRETKPNTHGKIVFT